MQTQLINTNGAHDMLHGYGGHGLSKQKPMWPHVGKALGIQDLALYNLYAAKTIDMPF